jgi:NADH dehydrogenase FAD-containing subunit
LQHEAHVTLIDPKDYFEIPMAVPRLLVEPARVDEALLPYAQFLPRVEHVRSRVAAVQAGFVQTSDGGRIPYDALVLATGSSYPTDMLKATDGLLDPRRAHFRQLAERIRQASRIAIVGGGPVGVEIAGEILQDLPGKSVNLYQKGKRLLPTLTPGPARFALRHLRQRGASVDIGSGATEEQLAAADLVLWCAGYAIQTDYLRDYPGHVLDPAGRVLVDSHLRMAGTENVYVAGDITALPEPKLGIWAGKHVAVIVENLRRGPGDLRTYKPATGNRMMLVTLGRRHGVGHAPFGDFTNAWLARKFKATDMFIGRYRKAVGLPTAS